MKQLIFVFLISLFITSPSLADDGGFGENYFANIEYSAFSNPEIENQLMVEKTFNPDDLNAIEPADGVETDQNKAKETGKTAQ